MRPVYSIYVEEQLIDLDPKTVIALTLQAGDFASGDIVTRKASYTNQIKVPASPTNIRIFEYANNPKSGSSFPYLKKDITIYANGIRILEGITVIKSFDTFFNLQIYSLPKDLNFRIANLYLSDLDFGDSPITWDAAYWNSVRNSTTGWCAPVINYGQMYYDTGGAFASIGTHYLPSISYKDTLTTILTNAGYTVSGSFYNNDTILSNLVLTYGRKDFPSTTLKMNEALSTTILQSDFLKDFLIRFGAFFKISNNNIEIVTYNDILSNTSNAIDWTNKRVRNKKDIIQYNWGSLAQVNNFNYNPLDTSSATIIYGNPDRFLNPDGSLTVNNENLNAVSDLYTSLFSRPNIVTEYDLASTVIAKYVEVASMGPGHWNCVTSNVWSNDLPSSYTFDNEPEPMIALLCSRDASETAQIAYTALRSDYKVARFSGVAFDGTALTGASAPMSLGWRMSPLSGSINGFLDVYYNQAQLLLDRGIIVTTHEYNLTDLDINNLDLLTPIYDDGNYYLINKINSYVSYKTTRVELLKI